MYTGTYLNPNNASFKEKINCSLYVDKTDLIKFCNERFSAFGKFVCSTRPRRFGKTMAIDMLAAYYSKGCDSKALFKDTNASKYNMDDADEKVLCEHFTEYMNAFNVIRIDMQSIMSNMKSDKSIDAVEWIQREVIQELKEVFGECVKEKESYGLSPVLKNIYKHKKIQFVILIDEWDALFRLDKNNKAAQEDYITFLRSLFKGVDIEECIAFAYITGILPIKKYGGESALNNFHEFTMVDPANMVEYIGFTEEETLKLCKEYDMDFDEMEKWYDGYTLHNYETSKTRHIYSPNSVCNAIMRKRITSYSKFN